MEIKKDINNIHDKSYKDLLSNKEVFINMIDSFIDTEWAKFIKKSEDLFLIDKSYILSDYEELESDIVYRAKIGEEEVIFYVLLEFQSSVDYSMPIRLFGYISEIWRDVLKNIDKKTIKRKDFRLPAIVPIVLYNGEDKWTASREFKNIVSRSEIFGDNIINFKYELLDVNRYEKEELVDLGNIISAIFMLDQKVDFLEFIDRLKEIALTFNNLDDKQKMLLKHWLRNVMSDELKDELKDNIENILNVDKSEVAIMTSNISKTIKEMQYTTRQQGIKEGIERGIERGIELAIRKMILKGMDAETISNILEVNIDTVKIIENKLN